MEKLPQKQKKSKAITKEELLNLSKENLIEKVLQLDAHNVQLKNIISKNSSEEPKSERNGKKKQFDFTKCHFRRVLLRILYFGWDYQGFAVQEDTTQTIEHHLFKALCKSCLIQSRETSNYNRCGRTDKGVSSFGQVISISLRSEYPPDQQSSNDSISGEMPYCKILNRLLPKEIRVVAWMPIPDDKPDFSARFDCKKRQYKYYFPRSNLDLPAMRKACSHLIGSHDFRHLCKMDVGNGVVEFRREIFNVDIVAVNENDADDPMSMYSLIIEGNAFLWHQIRCIMGLLLLVGQGCERPSVILELLDIEKTPRKPQYNMALDLPLNLFQCTYDIEQRGAFIYDKDELRSIIKHLQGEWTMHSIKTTMMKDSLRRLKEEYFKLGASETTNTGNGACESEGLMFHTDCLLQGVKPKVYKPLMKRETCSSLEERKEYYRKKKKLDETVETKNEENIKT